jgi:hypothetical protein
MSSVQTVTHVSGMDRLKWGPCVDGIGTDTSIHPYITLLEKLAESMKDPLVMGVLESFDLWCKNAQIPYWFRELGT